MMTAPHDIAMSTSRAKAAAEKLKLLANGQRLQILCRIGEAECSVSALVAVSGLSQSSISQHLARLREGGLVKTRREGTTIYYRLADPGVTRLIAQLCETFGQCDKMPANKGH